MNKAYNALWLICFFMAPFYAAEMEKSEYNAGWYRAPQGEKANPEWWKVSGAPLIERVKFFQDIVGFDEKRFREIYQWHTNNPVNPLGIGKGTVDGWIQSGKEYYDKAQEKNVISFIHQGGTSLPTGYRRAAIFQGTLYVVSLDELYTAYEKKQNNITTLKNDAICKPQLCGQPQFLSSKTDEKGYLRILLENPDRPWEVDIRYLQALPENRLAVFQVASTFRGPLEGGMAHEESLLTDMVARAVQGEEASISAAGATIYRKYFMGAPQWMLEGLQDKLPLYKETHQIDLNNVSSYKYAAGDEGKVKIGFHDNVIVTSGYGDVGSGSMQQRLPVFMGQDFRVNVNDPRNQIISQSFNSAYDTTKLRAQGQFNENAQNMCMMLLRAEYAATLIAAVLSGKQRVFLTLLGSGAFQNDIRWISNAFSESFNIAGKTIDLHNLIRENNLQVTLIYRPDKSRVTGSVRTADNDATFLKTMAVAMNMFAGKGVSEMALSEEQITLINEYTKAAYAYKEDDSEQNKLLWARKAMLLQPIFSQLPRLGQQVPAEPAMRMGPRPQQSESPTSEQRAEINEQFNAWLRQIDSLCEHLSTIDSTLYHYQFLKPYLTNFINYLISYSGTFRDALSEQSSSSTMLDEFLTNVYEAQEILAGV